MIISFFTYLIQVSICLSAFYAFYFFVLRKDNFFQINRFYLLFTASLSFLIPLFQIEINVLQALPESTFLEFENGFETITIIEEQTSGITIEQVLMGIYLAGVAFIFLKILASIFYLFKIFKTNKKQKNENGYIVFTKQELPVFSFLNTIFWNESNTYSTEEQEQIILHEQVHIRQNHSLDILFLEALNMVLWFNPFIYFYKKSLKITHEYIADEYLFQQQNFRLDYVALLMKEAGKSNRNSLPVVHTFFNNQLKQRLIMMKNINKPSSKFKLFGSLPIIGLLLASFGIQPVASAQTSSDQPAKAKAGTIFIAGDTDNDFTVRADGTRRSQEEIVQYAIAENAKDGKTLTEDDIVIITKGEMMKNLRWTPKEKPTQMESHQYRVTYVGGVGRIILSKKATNKTLTPLKMESFVGTLKRPYGKDKHGEQIFKTTTMKHTGGQLSQEMMAMINNFSAADLKANKLIISEIKIMEDGEKAEIPGDFSLSLK